MQKFIGLDIGTSSVKGVRLTEEGVAEKTAHESFVYTTDADGSVEIGAEAFLGACLRAIRTLAEGNAEEIKGVAASAATGNTLLLDEKGAPLTPIFNWQDTRVKGEAEAVLGKMDAEAFFRQIGWPFSGTTFPLAHLSFWKVHQPELYKKAKYVAMSTEYLYKYLTGDFGISRSAGTPFYVIDQERGEYIPEILEKLEITEEMLPKIGKTGEIVGRVKKERVAECGLLEGTPFMLGTFDHPSAARGAGVLKEGQLLLSCGTSWVGFFPIGDREKALDANMILDPFLSESGGPWAAMISVPSISAQIKLYVNRYIAEGESAFAVLSSLCAKAEPGAGGLQLNITEAPKDEQVEGFSKENIARAIMEGTVRLLKEKLDVLREKGIFAKEAIMVGGPSEDPMWRKMIEEMCGIAVSTAHGAHAGAVGAAIMAGIGAGVFANEEDAILCLKGEK